MRFKYLALSALSALLIGHGVNAGAQTCAAQKQAHRLGMKISQAALNEYREFNGHRINAEGYLWKFGAVESETELLHDPERGEADAGRSGRFAWRRVWEYWLTLDRHVPGEAFSRRVTAIPGLLSNPDTARKPIQPRLNQILSGFTADDKDTDHALRQAAVRAALNDSPWSAAFISYLMSQAGMTGRQFRYASAHWRYIQAAFEAPEGYAYKACDPQRTRPAVGDLLCHSRGAFAFRDFAQWRAASGHADFAAASHCEVVVGVDTQAKKMELVGGNVMQSVTRRKLKLNAQDLLSDAHHPERLRPTKNRDCLDEKACRQPNFNVQYWSVLLQLQSSDIPRTPGKY